jgi:hypothetical protein
MVEQTSTPSSHPEFEALSPDLAYVLGTDGNLWLETGPWGTVPPSRQQVDGNVSILGGTTQLAPVSQAAAGHL